MVLLLSAVLTALCGFAVHHVLKKKRDSFLLKRPSVSVSCTLSEAGFTIQQHKAEEIFRSIAKAFGIPAEYLKMDDSLRSLGNSDSILGNSEGITDIEILLRQKGAKNLSIDATVFEVIQAVIETKE